MTPSEPSPFDNIIFREEQRLWRGVYVITAAVTLLAMAAMTAAVAGVFCSPNVDKPASGLEWALFWGSMAIGLLAMVATFLMIFLARLIVEVRRDGLYVRYKPFHLRPKKIDLDQVVRVEALTYSPLRTYGGWGIRWAIKGKAYNIRGHRGVRLDYANGKHLLLGSQRPDELAAAITSLLNT
jgi:hypothetical protein